MAAIAGKGECADTCVSCAPPPEHELNDKVEFTYTGVLFGVFLMDLRDLQIGHDGVASELLRLF